MTVPRLTDAQRQTIASLLCCLAPDDSPEGEALWAWADDEFVIEDVDMTPITPDEDEPDLPPR